MDLLSIVQTIWRHKIAIIPAILITGIGVAYVAVIKPPEYQAIARVLLIAPPAPPSPQQIAADPKLAKINSNNPYVDFGDLSIVSDVVLGVLNSGASQQTLLSDGVDARSQAGQSPDSGTIIQVDGIGKTAPSAIRAANIIAQLSIADLALLQRHQHVNPQYMIKGLEFVRPTQASLVLSGKLRYLIATLALGLILLFITVSAAEAVQGRRRVAGPNKERGGNGGVAVGVMPPRTDPKWLDSADTSAMRRNLARSRRVDRP